MKNILFSILALLFVSLFTQNATAQTAADEQSVRNTISKAMDDYYAADADKLTAYYAENATMVAWTGQKITGKKAIRESIAEDFKREKPTKESFKLTVSSVRFLGANTALVVSDLSGASQMEGQTIEWKGVAAIVLSRHGDKWLIELEANTPIMSMPETGK